MMIRLFLIAALVAIAATQNTTTAKPHRHTRPSKPTSEPTEKEDFKFVYVGATHQMVIALANSCYVFKLSDGESAAAHTNIGMRTLELKLLGLLSTATKTEVQQSELDRHVIHVCGSQTTNYYSMTAQ